MPKKPQNLLKIFVIVLLSIYSLVMVKYPVYSDEIDQLVDEIQQKEEEIDEKESLLSDVESKIASIANSNYSLSQKINMINSEISDLEDIISEKEQEIDDKLEQIDIKQKDLSSKKVLLDDISSELYMESRYGFSHFLISNGNWDAFVENIFVKKNVISFLKDEIEKINSEFTNLAESKAELAKEKEDLDTEREELDESYQLLADEKAKLQRELNSKYATKNSLSSEIEDLNDKVSQLQQALIAARSAGLVSTGGTTGTEDGTAISQAPSGYFGVFSIGAYTHRNGMSQWGARARADAGQSYTQILNAYYPGKSLRTGTVVVNGKSEAITDDISVEGYGTLDFEAYYLMGIKEIPETWDMDVLKAQAIAARTFAVRHTTNGRTSICTTQSCQVFSTPLKTAAWKTAVEQTAGVILTNSDGTPALTQYAAVHGAWVNGVGWDTVSGGGSNWFVDAWEKKSGVTWFYKSWYRYGTSSSGTNCGHSPWFSPTEMVDLINSYKIKNGIGVKGSPDLSRLLPADYGLCPDRLDYGRTDKDPYTSGELKSFLISPVQSIYSVSTSLSNGLTNSVTFYTNAGNISMTGLQFKNIYNQIAPGHMRIQQQSFYAFFNIEKK